MPVWAMLPRLLARAKEEVADEAEVRRKEAAARKAAVLMAKKQAEADDAKAEAAHEPVVILRTFVD